MKPELSPAKPATSASSDPSSIGDLQFMRECLREALSAEANGEVPVGAIVVCEGRIIGRGHNASVGCHDPSAHAEIVALREAGKNVGNYRLPGVDLFVTVEPCLMCVGAIIQARLRRVVFGCADPQAGALGGMVDFSRHPQLNHHFAVSRGVCEQEARELLRRFFQERRQ